VTDLLTMESRDHDGSIVWNVQGEIDLASAPKFERSIIAGLEGGPRAVVVELDRVRYLDSAGLASLVRLHLLLDRQGSRLKLVVGNSTVARGTLTLAALDQVISLFDTLDSALAD
jgi:anti-sigma B factor antagonist